MPPKRKALEPANPNVKGPSNRKKAKSAAAEEDPVEPQQQEQNKPNASLQLAIKRRERRWAKVSGTKNLDIEYLTSTQDPSHAYEFLCVCNPLQRLDDALNARNKAEGNGHANSKTKKPKRKACDKGKTCPCGKSATELPSHPYTMTRAALARHHMAADMMNLRNPDAFSMYTFNDHVAYGALEVVQNMLLDFDEAFKAQNWHEAWAVVEGTALFMLVGEGDDMCLADDGEMITTTVTQIARMVLTAVASLERSGQLANDSDTKNVGWVMALYQRLAQAMYDQGTLEEARPSTAKMFKFHAGNLQLYLQSYASRYGITMPGTADISGDANLTMPKGTVKDPWSWVRSLSNYRRECVAPWYAFRGGYRDNIGGDGLDISTWDSEERKEHNFDKEDPLPKDAIEMLEKGLVLTLA